MLQLPAVPGTVTSLGGCTSNILLLLGSNTDIDMFNSVDKAGSM